LRMLLRDLTCGPTPQRLGGLRASCPGSSCAGATGRISTGMKDTERMSSVPEIVVLYCQHSVAPDADVAVAAQQARGFLLRPKMMPCSSKVEVPHLLRILEQGADGVELVACPEDKCRFLVGSLMAGKRVRRAKELLEEIRFGSERLGISHTQPLSAEGLLGLAKARAEVVKPLGPNPMKKGNRP
jgi:coenzyme F420-reducing hydrogenase delta subunit